MAVMSIKVAIAIGIGSLFLLAISCFFCWGVKMLRHRTRTIGQIAATPEIPVEHRIVLKKEKVDPFPVANPEVKASTLGMLDNCITREKFNDRSPNHQVVPSRSIYSNSPSAPSTPKPPTILPSWVHFNRPVPLPETAIVNSHPCAYDLEQCVDISLTFGTDIPVEKRHPSSSDRSVDSFSFGIPSADAFTFPELGGAAQNSWDAAPTIFRSSLRHSRSKGSTTGDSSDSSNSNPRTRYLRSSSMRSRLTTQFLDSSSFKRVAKEGYGHSQSHERYEHVTVDHQPSTVPQDQYPSDVSFILGSGNHNLRPSQTSTELLKVASSRNPYSKQLETSKSTRWERL
ncbi:uncharacterized protein [Physcomitrium patens]|uniref:Uncharacterized protein n=1 Tax=Physcomitrium patens TaxID=3218 RepID=A0A7I4F3R3_PHYPA|nr:uncharacterized protein LOC112291064 isoform X2 [Physcomitrium patens]|eukprot:XP_024393789.1 uncharacterized protein LOC112291064 isoform X2 [Physcomitrella patens]